MYLFYALLISLLIQAIGLTYGYWKQSDHLTDLLYGLTFLALSWWAVGVGGNESFPSLFLLALICLWSIRISVFLFIRIKSMKRDKRFDDFRANFWKLLGFWSLQGVTVWIILLPSLIFWSKSYPASIPAGILSGLGAIIFLTGLLIEAIADQQKFTFKKNPDNKGKWIASGLWAYSRHPNYLGEILCWVGAFIYCLPVLNGIEYLSIISPLFITLLLTKVSGIPILEKKADERWGQNPEYQKYKKETPVLIMKINSGN